MKKEKANSPKALGKYVKVENIDKKDNSKLVSLGVYKKNNKYFFIKVWHGRIRDITYYLLLNEFYVSSLLFKKMHGQVSVPKPIETIVTPNCMSFVYQYVNGKQLDKFSKKTQADVVSKIIRELEKKSEDLTRHERLIFGQKKYSSYIYISLVIYLRFIILDPKNIVKYTQLITKELVQFSKLVLSNNQTKYIAHRDLTPDNIIVSGNKIYLLDFENTILTKKYYDIDFLRVSPENYLLSRVVTKRFSYRKDSLMEKYILSTLASGEKELFSKHNIFTKKLLCNI